MLNVNISAPYLSISNFAKSRLFRLSRVSNSCHLSCWSPILSCVDLYLLWRVAILFFFEESEFFSPHDCVVNNNRNRKQISRMRTLALFQIEALRDSVNVKIIYKALVTLYYLACFFFINKTRLGPCLYVHM